MESRAINKLSKRLMLSPIFLGCFILPVLIFVLFQGVSQADKKTIRKYQELMANNGLKKDDLQIQPYQISQNREHVQKEIWFVKNDHRMQLKIFADQANLVFDHHDNKTEMVEHMNNITCWMQEELYFELPTGEEFVFAENGEIISKGKDQTKIFSKETYHQLKPKQYVRVMTAKTGVYHYKSDYFVANDVKIDRYLMEGHVLDALEGSKKLMSGIADSIEFSLKGNNLEFKANKLKAILYEPKSGVK